LELKNSIDEYLKEKYNVIPVIKDPDKVISILITNDKCFIGISDVGSNLSSWNGGMIHYKKDDNDVSRAKFKLMEAIYVFEIDMFSIHNAIDLGAAPGGWTSVLLEHDITVTAVDTGDMDQSLLENKNLTFIKENVSDIALEDDTYDMLTSDISWSPINTAKMALKCSHSLKKGGIAVVTVKLMNNKIGKTIKDVKNIYSEIYDIIQVKQLFHNRDEVTIYMKKR
jgi:23S rRNA (cytidine2498-2'-O)-methyltransferase